MVEHRTGIADVIGSNPVEAGEELFGGLLCNCSSCFTTASITFTCIVVHVLLFNFQTLDLFFFLVKIVRFLRLASLCLS